MIFHVIAEFRTMEAGTIVLASLHTGTNAGKLTKHGEIIFTEDEWYRYKLLMLGGAQVHGRQLDATFTVQEYDPRSLPEIVERAMESHVSQYGRG